MSGVVNSFKNHAHMISTQAGTIPHYGTVIQMILSSLSLGSKITTFPSHVLLAECQSSTYSTLVLPTYIIFIDLLQEMLVSEGD